MTDKQIIGGLSDVHLVNLAMNYACGNLGARGVTQSCALGCAVSGPEYSGTERVKRVVTVWGLCSERLSDKAFLGTPLGRLEAWYLYGNTKPQEVNVLVLSELKRRSVPNLKGALHG
jgi:hypothetical protein